MRKRLYQKLCKDLKELATKIINFEENEMIPLTDDENKFYNEQEECHICKKGLFMLKMKKRNLSYTKRSGIIVIIWENLEELLTAFVI